MAKTEPTETLPACMGWGPSYNPEHQAAIKADAEAKPAPDAVTMRVTAAQAKHAEWALSVMRDDYVDEEDCSYYQHPEAIPTIKDGAIMTLQPGQFGREATLDLLYRLEHQLPEMAESEGLSLPSVDRLTAEIRRVTGITEASL